MTLEQVKKLSDEELQIKVAELCGWTSIHPAHDSLFGTRHWPDGQSAEGDEVPNYPQDLNAMHEAEKTLPTDRIKKYVYQVSKVASNGNPNAHLFHVQGAVALTTATARQRAEAFVMTMEEAGLY